MGPWAMVTFLPTSTEEPRGKTSEHSETPEGPGASR